MFYSQINNMAQAASGEYFSNINGTLQEMEEGVSPLVQTYLVNNEDNLDLMDIIKDDVRTDHNPYSDPNQIDFENLDNNIGQAVFSTNGESAVVIEDLDSHHIIKEAAVTVNSYCDNNLSELQSPVVEEQLNHLELCVAEPAFQETLSQQPPAQVPPLKLFECRQCDYVAKDRWKLNRHIKVHESRKTFHCLQCQTVFYEAEEFYEHLKFHHEVKKPFVCTECVYRCTDRWKLTRHVKCHKYKLPYTNQDYKFKWKDDNVWVEPDLPRAPEELRRKSNIHEDKEEDVDLNCTQCEFKTRSKLKLQKHMKKEHNIVLKSGFACTECNFVTKRENGLKIHMAIHTGILPFGCSECDYRCDSSWKLKRHGLVHTRDKTKKQFKCTECDYATTTANGLKAHTMVHTGEKPFACTECDYRSRDNWKLTRHMLTHTGEKQFACDVCTFKAVELGVLKRHKLIHSGEKPFSCTECDYRCIDNGRLKRHMLVHSNENPFGCDQCEYKCRTKWQLKKHTENNHSAEKLAAAAEKLANAQTRPKVAKKRFPCTECNHKCKTLNGLKMHMITHTGEKPFACEKCDYKSKDTWKLKRHMQIHTGENPFSCEVCDYKCKANWQLKKHIKTHNSKDKNIKKEEEDDFYNNGSGVDIHEGINMEDFLQVGISEQHEDALDVSISNGTLNDVDIKDEPIDSEKGIQDDSCYPDDIYSVENHNGDEVHESEGVNLEDFLEVGISEKTESHNAGEKDGVKRFRCTECNHKCRDRWHLNRHMMTHTGENPFACKKCDYKCKTKVQIKKHNKNCKVKRSRKQPKKIVSVDIPPENSLLESNESTEATDHGSEGLNMGEFLEVGISEVTEEGISETPVEGRKRRKRNFDCKDCGQKFKDSWRLKRHSKTHTGVNNVLCPHCDYKCKTQGNLKKHIKTHVNDPDIEKNALLYNDNQMYVEHDTNMETYLGIAQESYLDTGNQDYEENQESSNHFLNDQYVDNESYYENQEPIKDDIVLQDFLDGGYMEEQSLSENKSGRVKRHACTECDYKARDKYSLKKHMSRHTGKKDFVCVECEFKCEDARGLKKHVLYEHTGKEAKPFACDMCDYRCKDSWKLKRHKKSHSKAKQLAKKTNKDKETKDNGKKSESENEKDKEFIKESENNEKVVQDNTECEDNRTESDIEDGNEKCNDMNDSECTETNTNNDIKSDIEHIKNNDIQT